mmetsp:Transcript_2463/g.9260  ORF Transcript_2463/g.9260 Transcript_2463/m.9260 type:complete len:626 (-) Transcript_2463:5915-7792(-)
MVADNDKGNERTLVNDAQVTHPQTEECNDPMQEQMSDIGHESKQRKLVGPEDALLPGDQMEDVSEGVFSTQNLRKLVPPPSVTLPSVSPFLEQSEWGPEVMETEVVSIPHDDAMQVDEKEHTNTDFAANVISIPPTTSPAEQSTSSDSFSVQVVPSENTTTAESITTANKEKPSATTTSPRATQNFSDSNNTITTNETSSAEKGISLNTTSQESSSAPTMRKRKVNRKPLVRKSIKEMRSEILEKEYKLDHEMDANRCPFPCPLRIRTDTHILSFGTIFPLENDEKENGKMTAAQFREYQKKFVRTKKNDPVHPYPLGYTIQTQLIKGYTVIMRVEKDDQGPVFALYDNNGNRYHGTAATTPITKWLRTVQKTYNRSGSESFGFDIDTVQNMIKALPHSTVLMAASKNSKKRKRSVPISPKAIKDEKSKSSEKPKKKRKTSKKDSDKDKDEKKDKTKKTKTTKKPKDDSKKETTKKKKPAKKSKESKEQAPPKRKRKRIALNNSQPSQDAKNSPVVEGKKESADESATPSSNSSSASGTTPLTTNSAPSVASPTTASTTAPTQTPIPSDADASTKEKTLSKDTTPSSHPPGQTSQLQVASGGGSSETEKTATPHKESDVEKKDEK